MPDTLSPAPEPPAEPLCLICEKPLGPGEIQLSRSWHFDCEKCAYCGGPVNTEVIEKSLDAGHQPAHPACRKTHLFSEFQSKDLVLRLEHVQLLNTEINSFFPAVDPNHVDIELLYTILKELKTAAASVSYALDVTKDKIQIQRSHNFNADNLEKKKEQIRRARSDAAEDAQKAERAATLAAERDNPELRARRKTIEGLQKTFKLATFAEAENMLNAMMAQQQKSKDAQIQ